MRLPHRCLLPLLAALLLGTSACSTRQPPLATTVNATEPGLRGTAQTGSLYGALTYDNFVRTRTDQLYRSGAAKSFADAEAQAREEASRRFGAEIPPQQTATIWTSQPAERKLTQSELDAARKKAATD